MTMSFLRRACLLTRRCLYRLDTQHVLMEGLRIVDEWSLIEGKLTPDTIFEKQANQAPRLPLMKKRFSGLWMAKETSAQQLNPAIWTVFRHPSLSYLLWKRHDRTQRDWFGSSGDCLARGSAAVIKRHPLPAVYYSAYIHGQPFYCNNLISSQRSDYTDRIKNISGHR